MTQEFKPTNDQLFDYHLKITDPVLTRQIEDYFTSHPEEKNLLTDFEQIEEKFKDFPLQQPKPHTIEKVRRMAAKQVHPGFISKLLKKSFLGIPVPRSLAWGTMIFVIVGLSFALKELRKSEIPFSHPTAKEIVQTGNGLDSSTATATRVVSDNIETSSLDTPLTEQSTKNTEATRIFKNYMEAINLYHQNKYKEASHIFENILALNPRFKKRVELYTYWIQALEKMDKIDLANSKKKELERIQQDESL